MPVVILAAQAGLDYSFAPSQASASALGRRLSSRSGCGLASGPRLGGGA